MRTFKEFRKIASCQIRQLIELFEPGKNSLINRLIQRMQITQSEVPVLSASRSDNAGAHEQEPSSLVIQSGGDFTSDGITTERILAAPSQEEQLDLLARAHFRYFVHHQDAITGLTSDRSRPGSPASIAATGFALTAYPVAVERSWIARHDAVSYTLKVFRALWNAPQGCAARGVSGNHGFFYHFLDATSVTRFDRVEISTIDTALLMAGVLFAREYFDQGTAEEKEIRTLAAALYERVDWAAAVNSDGYISHGWIPESGMIPHDWRGYDEGTLLVLMGLGSPDHPLPADSWNRYMRHCKVAEMYGQRYLQCGPMFAHQYTQCWLDLRSIRDPFMSKLGFSLFENSRRAAIAQHSYAVDNPRGWRGFGELDWGLTACDGPGWRNQQVDGKQVEFFDYIARGFPDSPEDGTIAPTAAVASLPFAPELVLPTIRHWLFDYREMLGEYGFQDSFNPTFDSSDRTGWIAPCTVGIDQGPIVLMIENYRSEFVWSIMKRSRYVRKALNSAGFSGGWLE